MLFSVCYYFYFIVCVHIVIHIVNVFRIKKNKPKHKSTSFNVFFFFCHKLPTFSRISKCCMVEKNINKKNLTRQNISYGDSVEMYHNKNYT